MPFNVKQPPAPLIFKVACPHNEEVCIEFFAVPRLADQAVGGVRIDWGDGASDLVSLALTPTQQVELISGGQWPMVKRVTHTYNIMGTHKVTVSTPSGYLPLKSLPHSTVEIASSLPVLTTGETDTFGKPVASDTLPRLVGENPETGLCRLKRVHPELLYRNPQLEIFDEAFLGAQITEIAENFFSRCEQIVSAVRTFACSGLTSVPYGLLRPAGELSLCRETFAFCDKLEHISDPFAGNRPPADLDGFLRGCPPEFFFWCPHERRTEAGWLRPCASYRDPSFEFEWLASGKTDDMIMFYPVDLEIIGDFFIDWGDGTSELLDWNSTDVVKHTFAKPDTYRVKLHYISSENVRPFRLGYKTTAIYSALPRFHPRKIGQRGFFRGWAANSRLLREVPAELFCNNRDIIDLEQAFAGCESLEIVPDDLLEGMNLHNTDAMFAFCRKLRKLPESYARTPHNPRWDYFVEAGAQEEAS